MKTLDLIQYVERFETKEECNEAFLALTRLDGFSCGRCYESEMDSPRFVAQAFFEDQGELNFDNDETRLAGFRRVKCPLSFLLGVQRDGDLLK